MSKAVISGDIIAFTSLNTSDKRLIEKEISMLFGELKNKYNIFGRVIKGDYIECLVPKPKDALRAALLIRSRIKICGGRLKSRHNRKVKLFELYGARLAIGIGSLKRVDLKKGIIDGEAIYFSGRLISESGNTSDKSKVRMKQTLFIRTNDEKINTVLETMILLLDVLLQKSTARQNRILYMKLTGMGEDAISKKLRITQSSVNQHSTAIGWNAIEQALKFYEKITNKI